MKETDYNEQVILAEKIARKAHEGQFRNRGDDKGKPYIVHPERIANRVKNPIVKAAAWLHDVVEDANIGFEEISDKGICEEILDVVELVTKKPGENYFDFILRIVLKNNKYAIELKIEDLKDNMFSLEEGSLKDKYRFALNLLQICEFENLVRDYKIRKEIS